MLSTESEPAQAKGVQPFSAWSRSFQNVDIFVTNADLDTREKLRDLGDLPGPGSHSMGRWLPRYLSGKLDPSSAPGLFMTSDWQIEGGFQRINVEFLREKRDKLFNWMRPTWQPKTKHHPRTTLFVYPGRDYTLHYGLIVASYLEHCVKMRSRVNIALPSRQDLKIALSQSNLDKMPLAEVVVLGYVEQMARRLAPESGWEGEGVFRWRSATLQGRRVAFLGSELSYWGDIGGLLVHQLARQKARCVLYMGKLGALIPEISPNTALATGAISSVRGERVTWTNYFDSKTRGAQIISGKHFTHPSILLETRDWAARAQADFDFVDPEIGPMAVAARESNIDFSFLHLISDNLLIDYPENLTNERMTEIVQKRELLFAEMAAQLQSALANYP